MRLRLLLGFYHAATSTSHFCYFPWSPELVYEVIKGTGEEKVKYYIWKVCRYFILYKTLLSTLRIRKRKVDNFSDNVVWVSIITEKCYVKFLKLFCYLPKQNFLSIVIILILYSIIQLYTFLFNTVLSNRRALQDVVQCFSTASFVAQMLEALYMPGWTCHSVQT